VYYFNSRKVPLDYTKYYEIHIIKNMLVLKQNREHIVIAHYRQTKANSHLTDSNEPKM